MALTVQDLVQEVYGKGTAADQNESDPVLNATTPVLVGRNSPARFSIIVSNPTSAIVALSTNAAMTFPTSIQIPPGGSYVSNWLTDLDSPSRALWGMIATGSASVHVVEQFLVAGAPNGTT